MTFDAAIRATEILLALAFFQQSAEHIIPSGTVRLLFLPRAIGSLLVLVGFQTDVALLLLSLHSAIVLHHYQGPYNGGSDRMGLFVLYCLTLAHWLPAGFSAQMAFGYLAIQVVLSYFMSGLVKITNPDWRGGQALQDVFAFSTYPVSESLRLLADRPRLLHTGAWAVMLFELAFPMGFVHPALLKTTLAIAFAFHVANACLFGLNRFVWFWAASYPSLFWLQAQIFPP